MNFSERFRKARNTLKLTQDCFAQPLGVNRAYIASIENGTREPSDTLLRLIEHEHRISVAWLRTGKGEMFIPPEELLKNIIARFGERAFLDAVNGIMKENGLALVAGWPNHRAGTDDPVLDRLVNTLYDLWATNDCKLRNWAEIQFDIAIPKHIVEEAKKKHKENTGQAQVG